MASADYSVLTPERVSVEYGIAGIGSRGGAAIIDTLLQCVALTVVLVAGLAGAAAINFAGFAADLNVVGAITFIRVISFASGLSEAVLIAVIALGLFAIA